MKKKDGMISRMAVNQWLGMFVMFALVLTGCSLGESVGVLSPEAMPGAELVTVISPDGPLPVVVASEKEEEYYGNRVKAHQDAAADLCYYLSRVTGRDIKPGMDNLEATVIIHVGPP